MEVHKYLCLAAPFGSPIETSPTNLKFYQQTQKAGNAPPKLKVRKERVLCDIYECIW